MHPLRGDAGNLGEKRDADGMEEGISQSLFKQQFKHHSEHHLGTIMGMELATLRQFYRL